MRLRELLTRSDRSEAGNSKVRAKEDVTHENNSSEFLLKCLAKKHRQLPRRRKWIYLSLTVINAETTSLSDLPKKNVNIVKNLNYTQGLATKSISVFQTLCFFSIDSFRI